MSTIKRSGALGAAVILLSVASAANAADFVAPASTYSNCDGYGMPASGGDGMTKYAMVLGIFNPPGYGTTARTTADRGRSGIAACDAALAGKGLKPAYWMRRVSLLHARALHRLEADDFAGAIADLDLAQAAIQAPDDPFFARSLGLSLQFARAYALRRQGQDKAAAELAASAARSRPYTRSAALGAIVVMGDDSTSPEYDPMLQALARFQPSALDMIYVREMRQRRWADVIALYPQLRPPEKRERIDGYGGYREVVVKSTFDDGMFAATRAGACAYALAASGRGAEARALLNAAREKLVGASEPVSEPILQPGEKPPTAAEKRDFDAENRARRRLRSESRASLDQWSDLVEHRILVAEHKVPAALERLRTHRLHRDPLSAELLDALIPQVPAKDAEILAALKTLRAQLDEPEAAPTPAPRPTGKADQSNTHGAGRESRVAEANPTGKQPAGGDIYQLFQYLPEAETRERLPRYKKAAIFFGSADGFTVADARDFPDAGGPAQRIYFRGLRASGTVVEELAILRAADLALQQGKTGFVVLDRDDTQYEITSTYYGMPMRSDPNGFGTSLTVVFVDQAALPEQYRGTPWRVIDARAVYDTLAPIYIRPDAKKR